MDRGVIYVATGPMHVAEALISAASVKRHMPDLPITLFCNVETADPNIDQIAQIETDPSWPTSATKHTHIAASPYHQTLYLDTDTYVCGNLNDLFAILEVFDLAAAHSPTRAMHEVDGVPDSFPELNTGVILFRRCAAVEALFSKWGDVFARNHDRLQRGEIRWLRPAHQRFHLPGDQGAFREALYRSTVRIATLPPEYNCRFSAPGFVDGSVKILHGRGADLSEVAARINATSTWRGYEERGGALRVRFYPAPSRDPHSLSNIRYTMRRRGLHWTVHAGLRRLVHMIRGSVPQHQDLSEK
jgi:hypothetical protein